MTPNATHHLSNNQRDTLARLLQHPTSHNITWKAVLSLLEAIGTVEPRHDGKYHVRIGDEVEVITRPESKDVDVQLILDLRRMLTDAGYGAVAAAMHSSGKEV